MLALPGRKRWAVEVKRSSAPGVEKGFRSACADLKPHRRFVVYPGIERFSVGGATVALGMPALAAELQAMR